MIDNEYNKRINFFLKNVPVLPLIINKDDIFKHMDLIQIWIIKCNFISLRNIERYKNSIISIIPNEERREYNNKIKIILIKYYSFVKIEILSLLLLFINIYFSKIFVNVKPIRILFFNFYVKRKTESIQTRIENYLKFFNKDLVNIPLFALTDYEKIRYSDIKKKSKIVKNKIQIFKIKNIMYFECFYKGTANKINSYDIRRYIFDFIF